MSILKKPDNLAMSYLPGFIMAFKEQLRLDYKRWGDTWQDRSRKGIEVRIFSRIQDYYDQWRYGNVPMPWLKIAGNAFFGWIMCKSNVPTLQVLAEAQAARGPSLKEQFDVYAETRETNQRRKHFEDLQAEQERVIEECKQVILEEHISHPTDPDQPKRIFTE